MAKSLKCAGKKRSDFTYTQFPLSLKNSIYSKAREWIIDFFSKIDEVVAVYEYGTVRSPGLSDLDLMVVLKDKIKDKNLYSRLVFKDIPERLSILANNDSVKFIERKYFKNINRLGEFRKKLLYGEEIKCNDIFSDQAKLFRIALIMDFLPERVLTLLEYRENKIIPVTDTMGILKSYLYSAKIAEEITQKNIKEVDEFEKEINCARKNWFLKSYSEQTELLLCLVDKAIYSGLKIVESMASFLTENGYYLPRDSEKDAFFFFNRKKGFFFYGSGTNKNARKKNYFMTDKESVFLSVPIIWLSHFCFYGQHKGIISSRIRDNLILKQNIETVGIETGMSEILSLRISMCNEMAESFQKLGVPTHKLYRFAHIQSIKKALNK